MEQSTWETNSHSSSQEVSLLFFRELNNSHAVLGVVKCWKYENNEIKDFQNSY
jgi:hypothetical protein